MGIFSFSWLRRSPPPVEQKASAAGAAISSCGVGQPAWTARDYAGFAEEAYRRNAVAFRCIKMIASGAAAAPWLLYDRAGSEIERHPLLDLLKRPAPMTAGAELFEAVYAYLLISGNSYIEAVGPDRRPPRELWTLRPDRMRVIVGGSGMPQGYEYEAYGYLHRWDADPLTGNGPICHIREFNPLDDWYGMSRVEPAAYGIDRHNAASAHNKALLDNGARPSGALIFEPVKVGDDARTAPEQILKNAERDLLDRHQGPGNAGRPLVFGGNVHWESMGITPRDMDFNVGKDDAARDICNAFGVPHLLVVPGSETYSNIRDAELQLWEKTILPLVDRVLDSLNMWLAPRFGDGLRLDIDKDEISALEPRRESKRKTTIELFEKGLIDHAEARAALQYGPKDMVRNPDASLVTALADVVQTVGIAPLANYMRSFGLVGEDVTDAEIVAAADAFVEGAEPSAEEEDAALALARDPAPDGGAANNGDLDDQPRE